LCQARGGWLGANTAAISSKTIESWTFAALSTTASGMPLRSEIRWRFVPFIPLSVGFAPVLHSPFGGDGSRINTDALPIDLLSLPKTAEQKEVQPLPHTRLIPFLEPSWWLPDHWLE
jgi:hypothetical protein